MSKFNFIDYKYRNPVIAQGSTGAGGKNIATRNLVKKRIETLLYGINNGIKIIDTAPSYEDGHSEEIVGKAIKKVNRNKIIVCTKVEPDSNSYDGVIKSFKKSLSRLKTHYIDIYQVHWPNPGIPISETMEAFSKLVDDQKIRRIGVCNFTLREILEAEKQLENKMIYSVQTEYNLKNRVAEIDLFSFCKSRNKILFGYNLFNQGYLKSSKIILNLAEKYGVNEYQIIVNWSLSNNIIIPILNSMNLKHIQENINATKFSLSSKDVKKINKSFIPQIKLINPKDIQILNYYQIQLLPDLDYLRKQPSLLNLA